jgi:hypothetical protein
MFLIWFLFAFLFAFLFVASTGVNPNTVNIEGKGNLVINSVSYSGKKDCGTSAFSGNPTASGSGANWKVTWDVERVGQVINK